MKHRLFLLTLTILCVVSLPQAQNKARIANPAIDMEGYLRVSAEAAKHRESRRLSEDEFIRMSREPEATASIFLRLKDPSPGGGHRGRLLAQRFAPSPAG